MKIYVSHPSSTDYAHNLYRPLRESELNAQHEIILPHEHSTNQLNSKAVIKSCDLLLADISAPSTGSGVEQGYAEAFGVPIVYLCKKGAQTSPSFLRSLTQVNYYESAENLISQIVLVLKQWDHSG